MMSQFLFLLVARYCCSSKEQERAHAKRLINMKSREREREKNQSLQHFFFVTNNALHRTGLHRFKGIFFKLKKKSFEMVNKFLSYRLFPP